MPKISELPPLTSGFNPSSDMVPVVNSGVTYRVSIANLFASAGGGRAVVVPPGGSIQAAIDALLPFSGTVILPAGRTTVASAIVATIPSGVVITIDGMGPGVSELYFSNASNGLDFTLGVSGGVWGGVRLTGFSIMRGPTSPVTANTGVRVSAVSDTTMCSGQVVLRDLLVCGAGVAPVSRVNQWANSVVLAGPNGAIIENVTIYAPDAATTDTGDVGLLLTGGPAANQYATSFNVLNCLIWGGSCGIDISGWVQGVLVSNSTIIGQYDSIRWLDPGGVHLAEELAVDNCSLNARHRGIYADAVTQSSVSSTTILHFALAATEYYGIEFKNTYLTSIIGNNVVGANSGGEDGIVLTDSTASVVMGNAMTNINGYGIYFKGTTTTCSAIGNVITVGSAILSDSGGNTFSANTHNGFSLTTPFRQPIVFTTNTGVSRWFVGNDGTTESGGNSGNDFEIVSADDAGGLITGPLRIVRATGVVSLSAPPKVTGGYVDAINDSAAATAGVQIGQEYRNGSVKMVRVT